MLSRMPEALPLHPAQFARAKKTRRAGRGDEPPAPAAPLAPQRERVPPLGKLLLACAAAISLFAWMRIAAPLPWSYDEYYHLGLAREMRTHFRIETFHWTPFSILYDRFADGEPLFHLLLMPFAKLPLQTAGVLGALLGQVFLVGAFAASLWIVRAPRPWWFVLALGGLGTLFAQRMEMCRPHVWLIGFALLVTALLVERRWKALAVACALFGLVHTAGWIAIPLALCWSLSGLLIARGPDALRPDEKRIPWQPVAAATGGWLAGQLVHPELPANFHLIAIANFVVPFQATAATSAALRNQLGTELSPPGLDLLREQLPALVAPLLVAIGLIWEPRVRTRATLTAGLTSIAFLLAGGLAIRRFFELGAPLALFALALVLRERRDRGLPPLFSEWARPVAAAAIALGTLWTVAALRPYRETGAAPLEMSRWLAAHGAPGERVFTAQWADSAPLFYSAPQLQSLVALDPTAFYLKDPQLFAIYEKVASGVDADPARTIRERFGARWVTILPQLFPQLLTRLGQSTGVEAVYGGDGYMVIDLGKSAGKSPGKP
jgi:hypothetical protein